MKIPLNRMDKHISYLLILLMITSIYAINDQKTLLYLIRGMFIVYMFLRLLFVRHRLTIYSVWTVSVLFITGASILWAFNQSDAIHYFVWLLQVMLVTIPLSIFIDDEEKLEFVIKCFVVGGVLLIVRLIIETPATVWGIRRLGAAIGYNANDLGMKLAFAALCTTYLLKKNSKKKLFLTAIFVLMTAITMLTGSRKAFVLLVLGVVLYNILIDRSYKKYLIGIPSAIILSVAFYYLVTNVPTLYNVLGSRLEDLLGTLQGTSDNMSTLVRMNMASVGLNMFSQQPLFGYGIGNFAIKSGFGTYSHNNYIELLTGIGIAGFITYYSLYVYLVINLLRGLIKGNTQLAFPFLIVVLILIIEVGLVSYNTNYIQILLMISLSFSKIKSNFRLTN